MILNSLYQKYNPNRRPDWRWERVLNIVDRQPSPGRATKRDDGYVRQGKQFLSAWRNREADGRQELFYENPGLYLAYQMFERQTVEPEDTLFLQGRLLANMDFVDIAKVMDTMPQAIEWYEALFFSVKEKLHARDWIVKQVLLPSMMRNWGQFDSKGKKKAEKDDDDDLYGSGSDASFSWRHQTIAKPFQDASLKMFAYYGGPVLCEFMISGFQQGKPCQSPDALAEWLDGHTALTLRARAAQAARTFEVNRYNVMELFAAHAKIMEIEKSSDSMDQKRTTIERHVGALISELSGVWAMGEDDSGYKGTEVPKYDAGAAELRDDELLLAAAGKAIKADGLELLTLPPTREKGGKPNAS